MAYYYMNLRDLKYVDNYFDNFYIIEKASIVSDLTNAAQLIYSVRDAITGVDAMGALYINQKGYLTVLIYSKKLVDDDERIKFIGLHYKDIDKNLMKVTPDTTFNHK